MKVDWHCIEFTHTSGWESRDRADDELATFPGLVSWCVGRGILNEAMADQFLAQAEKRPAQAAAALEEARSLRVLLYRVFKGLGLGHPPVQSELDQLNGYMQRHATARRLVRDDSGVLWRWVLDPLRPEQLVGPVIESAADLLTTQDIHRVRFCEGDDCGWVFFDGSRNRSRRWCDMTDCGNRAKVRRFRARQKGSGS